MAPTLTTYTQVVVSIDHHGATVYHVPEQYEAVINQVLAPVDGQELDLFQSEPHSDAELAAIHFLGGGSYLAGNNDNDSDDDDNNQLSKISVDPVMPCIVKRTINISMPMM
jgi:hypothetical protein